MAGDFFLLFTFAPVLRGLFALVLGGTFFPLCGVMVLKMNLIPLRYMLMHGVILGSALALALNIPVLPVCMAVNVFLVILMLFFGRSSSAVYISGIENEKSGFAPSSAAVMVLSMALSGIIMHAGDVSAKDTLSVIWGSPLSLKKTDLIVLLVLSIIILLYLMLNFQNLLALFFNPELASSLGIKTKFHYTLMVFIVALVTALAMKILGAFLIDSLLILPVLSSSLILKIRKGKKGGIKRLFILSSLTGLVFSLFGYLISLMLSWPPSATISLLSGLVFIILKILERSFVK